MKANNDAPFTTTNQHQSARNASAGMRTGLITPLAMPHLYGTTQALHTVSKTGTAVYSTKVASSSAGISSAHMDAQAKGTTTNAQAVVAPPMELKDAPTANKLQACLQSRALMPYKAKAWYDLLIDLGICHKHPTIIEQLTNGFCATAPTITQSFTPSNNTSTNVHCSAFDDILHKEFKKQQYIGPFTWDALEAVLRPFQSSPLSIIPKPGKPGKFHLIQNLSYPYSPQPGKLLSINAQVDPSLFPCKWESFYIACTLIYTLLQGCEGATRNIAKAHHTIPLHPSQWPALVVHVADKPTLFAVDTSLCFSYGPSARIYGAVQDAGLDILWAAGIGLLITWVNDHLFIWLPHNTITNYNELCEVKLQTITTNGRKIKDNGCWWFKGDSLADRSCKEFTKDCSHPIKDLTLEYMGDSPTSHAYDFIHIDHITDQLGIPWKPSKDTPFFSSPVFHWLHLGPQ